MTHRNFQRLKWFAVLLLAGASAPAALATAGGGNLFGGGFDGGGLLDFGGGGDGLLYLFWFLLRLTIQYPLIGIPADILVIAFLYWQIYLLNRMYKDRLNRRKHLAREQLNFDKHSREFRLRNPEFSEAALCGRVARAYRLIQECWSNQDMTPARAFLSDGIFERFQLQLLMQRSTAVHNVVTVEEIENVRIVACNADNYFDRMDFLVTARQSDYYLHAATGKQLYGSRKAEKFSEYWTLVRRKGAGEKNGASVWENCCPNCGTPLERLDRCCCPSCGAIVNSGDYDWVLTNLTQVEAYRRLEDEAARPGIARLQQHDRTFSPYAVADRTALIFYRYQAARLLADSRQLRKVATPEFIAANAATFQPDAGGEHRFLADAAIGSIELLGCDSESSAEFDFLTMLVVFSGHETAAPIPSSLPVRPDRSILYRQVFVLARRKGVKTFSERVLSSTFCPNCGAPETPEGVDRCEYCGTIWSDGSRNWVLTALQNYLEQADFSDPGLLATPDRPDNDLQLDSIPHVDTLLAAAAWMMLKDHEEAPEERRLLEQLARAVNVSDARLKMILSAVKDSSFELVLPEDPIAANQFLQAIARMALIDGKLSPREEKLLHEIGEMLHFSRYDVRQAINRQRTCLYHLNRRRNG